MQRIPMPFGRVLARGALITLLAGTSSEVRAQQVVGLSFGYESFPYVALAEPVAGAGNLEIAAASWSLGAAFPLSFGNGQVMILNQFAYRRTDFSYRNFPTAEPRIEQVQSVGYTMFLMDSLSPRWRLLGFVNPGLASDFEADLSGKDVTFNGALGFVRQMNRALRLGLGLVYSSDFGEPLPLPFLYVDWQIAPKLAASGILPTNLDVAYRLHPGLDLGLAFHVGGNRYHGDPARYGVADPRMKYSEGTVAPTVQLHLARWLHLKAEGGYAFYRKFELFDGEVKAQSFNLEKSGYLRTQVVLGL